MSQPKLEDVAKLAQVSKTTVSRVLNNRGYLSQKTIDKVNQAIKELNYQPNVVARQLYNKKTNIIGLLFPTVANPFFGDLIESLEKKLYLEGFKVIIGNSMNDSEKEADYLKQLLSEQVDGLIVGTHNRGIEEYQYNDLPIVAIDRIMNQDIPVVESDNYAGGTLATETLIKQGATRIIHTNGPTELETPAKRRREAYEDTMLKNGLTPYTTIVDFNLSYDEKRQIFVNLFEEFPLVDGIFASNDLDAAILLDVAKEFKKEVPKDLLIIGYDGASMTRQLLPQLTTIVQPIDEISSTAIKVLKQRMEKKETDTEYILPVRLHHGTTGFKP